MNNIHFVRKSWGSETWFQNNQLYCGKELYVLNGRTSSEGLFHYHKNKDETFYILIGSLFLEYYKPDDNPKGVVLHKGDSFRILPKVRHRFTAMKKDCRFIEVSTFHDDNDSYYERP
jgi:mannose-6-phosphate isomerase-like protein (cupin superfamily)